jgi:hypothetical protein
LGDTAASSSLLEEVSTDVTRVGALGLKRLIEAERY